MRDFDSGVHLRQIVASMDVQRVLKELLAATGWTQKRLAQQLGVEQVDVSRWLHGSVPRGPNWEAIRTLAQEYGIVPPEGIARIDLVTVVGLVSAGGKIGTEYEQPPPEGFERIEVGDAFAIDELAPRRQVVAFWVVGDSMLPEYEPGDIVICYADQPRDLAAYLGKRAVVETPGGDRYLKRIVKGRRKSLYNLESANARTMEDIEIARVFEIFVTVKRDGARYVKRKPS